jgi:hypothetical protein
MRKRNGYVALVAGAAVAALAVVPVAIGDGHQDLLRSGIAGSVGPGGPPIFDVGPAGAPWVANRHSTIRVKRNGDVRIKVRGFIIPNRVPPLLPNPIGTLAASIFCGGKLAATTESVPFSPDGNANIRDKVKLPKPCLAPAVLFLAPTGAYIGASG